MGDSPLERANSAQLPTTSSYDDTDGQRTFYGSSQSQHSHSGYPNTQALSPQQYNSQARQEPFNMASLGSALPDMSYMNYNNLPQQRYPSAISPPHHLHQLQNMHQIVAGPQTAGPASTTLPYNMQYQTPYSSMYMPGPAPSPSNMQAGMNAANQFYQSQGFTGQHQHSGSPYYMQPGQYGQQGQMYSGSPSIGQYAPRGGFTGDSRHLVQQRASEYQGAAQSSGTPGRSSSIASSAGQSSIVRGPPRKPRQSGHAIWIGNLPPQTDLMSLVLHVCKEAPGLESLFLISKSNCAFANFKDEERCSAAQMKIHDSRFQTVRLVSRLRRSSVGTAAGITVPTGPAASLPPTIARTPSPAPDTKDLPSEVEDEKRQDDPKPSKDKFFIVKSLTVEDLELSVRNGIWATQSHNEDVLNKAYETADNVYLIFSANKSGEYFGYAKMISPINDDPAAAIEFAPKAHTVEDPELPKAIPTAATEFAPKGRIIDDSARGTIFWEAERDENDGVDEEDETGSNRSDQDASPAAKAWGKPFKLEWLSNTRLPFYRTRGLRNPWNSNREVKIARDGTELETSIGRRLIGLFHRVPSPVGPTMQSVPVPLMGGYPPMGPFP